ncbi:WhiB family transcriptional regulator [Corynebacterium coyleae]|uniref:WhiB family transcriptional regulator n=1 Tax=Corynebacterium coyleae TaxID=53374 RepID=UPI002550D9B9|nr:WhiB family transcriptional regulator [Corynebacterium coyleae]MDK8799545.1 WhiB family transcriptional regulator [Corynebacterium coyleae]
MKDPACTTVTPLSVRDAFLFPEEAAEGNIERAKKVCQTCPALKACAREALYAGTDHRFEVPAPAHSVVMAGVLCDGSEDALTALEDVAGIQGIYKGKKRAFVEFGTPCRNCNKPMVPWSRYQPRLPEGYSMHRGRGLCVECRGVYQEELAAWRAAHPEDAAREEFSKKKTDRKRTSVAALVGKIETAVKNGDEELADELRYRWSVERDREATRKAVAKGSKFVKLPTRGEKTDQVLIAWQREPWRLNVEIAELCEVSTSLAASARSMLVVAEVPGFADPDKRDDSDAERSRRIRSAKYELGRRAAKRRKGLTLSLLRNRPDLTWSEVREFTGVGWQVITELVEKHDLPKRTRGRQRLTA